MATVEHHTVQGRLKADLAEVLIVSGRRLLAAIGGRSGQRCLLLMLLTVLLLLLLFLLFLLLALLPGRLLLIKNPHLFGPGTNHELL